jgi:hypothetical protein
MYRILLSRAPRLHLTLNGTSKLLRRVDAPASARLCLDVCRQLLSRATFFSSRSMMEPLGGSKQLPQPALFVT